MDREAIAILSHEDAFYSVDPLSSEDVAVVVDFHWFTDCHLEAIFNMNSSRLRLQLLILLIFNFLYIMIVFLFLCIYTKSSHWLLYE